MLHKTAQAYPKRTIILTGVRPTSMASSSLSARTSLMALNSLTMRSGLMTRSSRMLALCDALADEPPHPCPASKVRITMARPVSATRVLFPTRKRTLARPQAPRAEGK